MIGYWYGQMRIFTEKNHRKYPQKVWLVHAKRCGQVRLSDNIRLNPGRKLPQMAGYGRIQPYLAERRRRDILLSVKETAAMLGFSERHVRYLLLNEFIPGRKRGKSWVIRRSDLVSVFPELQSDVEKKIGEIREVTEKVLEKTAKKAGGRSFRAIRDMRVIQKAAAAFNEINDLKNSGLYI